MPNSPEPRETSLGEAAFYVVIACLAMLAIVHWSDHPSRLPSPSGLVVVAEGR